MSFLICHKSFVICHFSFVISHFSFVICHLSFLICHFSYLICHFSFLICHMSYVISHMSAQRYVPLIPEDPWRCLHGGGMCVRVSVCVFMCVLYPIGWLIFPGHFPQKTLMRISVSREETDLKNKTSSPKDESSSDSRVV